jgi:uncharacterized protein YceK
MKPKLNSPAFLIRIIFIYLMVCIISGCSVISNVPTKISLRETPPPVSPPTSSIPTDAEGTEGLSNDEIATLSSLEQVDDHPLYTMHYYGTYEQSPSTRSPKWSVYEVTEPNPRAWACSLFAALGDAENMLYGRNFDWEYSPALLLFTNPPDGYASVSMVDIAYLGFGETNSGTILELPLRERQALLSAPFLPFDGMNEHGLTVGMAAVAPGLIPPDPEKETIGSLMVIREMLDRAKNVDEAVDILKSYNIDMEGGPPLHYLIADLSGRSALVEFYQGEIVIMLNDKPWHQATNFLRAASGESTEGICWRYDRITHQLTDREGRLDMRAAIDLLHDVSQDGTQWSIVYGISTGEVNIVMGQRYETIHTFSLGITE